MTAAPTATGHSAAWVGWCTVLIKENVRGSDKSLVVGCGGSDGVKMILSAGDSGDSALPSLPGIPLFELVCSGLRGSVFAYGRGCFNA